MKYGLALAFGAISLIISIALSDTVTDGAQDLDVEFRNAGVVDGQRFDKVWTKAKTDGDGRNQDRGKPVKVEAVGDNVCATVAETTLYLFDGTQVTAERDQKPSSGADVNNCGTLPASAGFGTKAQITNATWSKASPLANEIGGILTLLTSVLPIVILGGLVIMATTTAFSQANMGAGSLGKQLLVELGYIVGVLIIMRMAPSITQEATDLYWTFSSGATIFNIFGGFLGILIALIPVGIIGLIFGIVAERSIKNVSGQSGIGYAYKKVRGSMSGGM